MEPDHHDVRSALLDVRRMPLRDLIDDEDSVIGNCLRRLVVDRERPPVSFTAFGNTPR